MKTSHLHPYHGITLSQGHWRIQIRANGKFRSLRAFSLDPETSARRHDIAMKRLEPFIDMSLDPNFPNDYDAIDTAKWFEDFERLDDINESQFRAALLKLFSELKREMEVEMGFDLETQQKIYTSERARILQMRNKSKALADASRRRHVVASMNSMAETLRGQRTWLAKLTVNLDHTEAQREALDHANRAIQQSEIAVQEYLSALEKDKS